MPTSSVVLYSFRYVCDTPYGGRTARTKEYHKCSLTYGQTGSINWAILTHLVDNRPRVRTVEYRVLLNQIRAVQRRKQSIVEAIRIKNLPPASVSKSVWVRYFSCPRGQLTKTEGVHHLVTNLL